MKELRSGYTTGTCAAAAARAAAWMLGGGEVLKTSQVRTRKGTVACLAVE